MTFDELQEILNGTLKGGQFDLSDDALYVPRIAEVLGRLGKDNALSLSEATLAVDEANARIKVTGTGAFAGAKTQVDAVFHIQDKAPQMALLYRDLTPSDWAADQSGLDIKGTVFEGDALAINTLEVVAQVDETSVIPPQFEGQVGIEFSLRPQPGDLFQGLQVTGDLTLSAQGVIGEVLGAHKLAMVGQMEIWDKVVRMHLRSDQRATLPLGPVELSASVQVIGVQMAAEVDGKAAMVPRGFYLLQGAFHAAGQADAPKLVLGARFARGSETHLTFFADAAQLANWGTDALLSLAGGAQGGFVPEEWLPKLQTLRAEIGVDLPERKVTEFALQFTTAEPMELIPGWLSIDQLGGTLKITDPFEKADRSSTLEMEGVATFADTFGVTCALSLPDKSFRLAMDAARPLKLRDVVGKVVGADQEPPDLPDLTCDAFSVEGRVGSLDMRAEAGFVSEDVLPLGVSSLSVPELRFMIERQDGKAKVEAEMGLKIGPVSLTLSGAISGKAWSLSGALGEGGLPSLKDLLRHILPPGTELPAEVPDVKLTDLSVGLSRADGKFGLELEADLEVDWKLAFADAGLTVSSAKLQFKRSTKGEIICAISIDAKGQLSQDIRFETWSGKFEYDSKEKRFDLKGEVTAVIYDQSVTLKAHYQRKDKTRKMAVSGALKPAWALLDVEGAAKVALQDVAFEVEGNKGKTNWSFSAKGHLFVQNLLEGQDVTATLFRKDKTYGFNVKADALKTRVPLSPDASNPAALALVMDTKTISLTKGKDGWAFKSETALHIENLPQQLQPVLGGEILAGCEASAKSIKLTAGPLAVMPFPLPPLDTGVDSSVELGPLTAGVDTITVDLKKLELDIGMMIGLPPHINRIFGVDEAGQSPKFLRAYDPKNHDKTKIALRVGLDTEGVFVRLDGSPFQAFDIEDGVIKLDFGEFGLLHIDVPTFKVKGSSEFSASVGMELPDPEGRPLKIPLTLLKSMLTYLGVGDLADQLPAGLPIVDVKVLDSQNRINKKPLLDALSLAFDGHIPPPVRLAVDALAAQVNAITQKLPTDLGEYLGFEVPKRFKAKISVTPTGNVDVKLASNPPLRVLYPTMAGPVPCLAGIKLSAFSVGTIMSGSLFSFGLDAEFDLFDLPSLVAGLALPETEALPNPRDFQQKLIVKDLLTLIIYQTIIPIPVPLFYTELAVRRVGIEGFQAGASISFPLPVVDLGEILGLYNALRQFFLDPKARLPGLMQFNSVVAADDGVWAINKQGHVVKHSDAGWENEGARDAVAQIAEAGGKGLWVVLRDGLIWHKPKGASWRRVFGRLERIDGNADKVWGSSSVSELWIHSPNGWYKPKQAHDFRGAGIKSLSVAENGSVAVVTDNGTLQMLRPETRDWVKPIADMRFEQAEILADDVFWTVGADRRVRHHKGGKVVHDHALNAVQVSASPDGTRVWATDVDYEAHRMEAGKWSKVRGKPAKGLPQNMDLRFTFNQMFIELPSYLGGAILGSEDEIFSISLMEVIAAVMNSVKFLSMDDILMLMPASGRSGRTDLDLFFIKQHAEWLITTPREFALDSYGRLGLTPEEVKPYLDLIPEPVDNSGVITFLKGNVTLKDNVGHMASMVCVVASGPDVFATEVKMSAHMLDVFDFDLHGRVLVQKEPASLLLEGRSHVDFLGHRLFNSNLHLSVTESGMKLDGLIALDAGNGMGIWGEAHGRMDDAGLTLDATVVAKLALLQVGDATLKVRTNTREQSKQVTLRGSVLGATTDFSFEQRSNGIMIYGVIEQPALGKIQAFAVIPKEGNSVVSHFEGYLFNSFIIFTGAYRGSEDSQTGEMNMQCRGLGQARGTFVNKGDRAEIHGDYQALEGAGPFKIGGQFSGTVSHNSFHFKGDLTTFNMMPGILMRASGEISSDGLSVTFRLFDAIQIGPISVVDRGDFVNLRFETKLLSVFSYEHSLDVLKSGFDVQSRIKVEMSAWNIQMVYTVDKRGVRGDFVSHVGNMQVIHGTLSIDKNALSLHGRMNIPNLGSIVIRGSVGRTSVHLTGEVRTKLPLPLPELRFMVGFSNKGALVAGQIEGVATVVTQLTRLHGGPAVRLAFQYSGFNWHIIFGKKFEVRTYPGIFEPWVNLGALGTEAAFGTETIGITEGVGPVEPAPIWPLLADLTRADAQMPDFTTRENAAAEWESLRINGVGMRIQAESPEAANAAQVEAVVTAEAGDSRLLDEVQAALNAEISAANAAAVVLTEIVLSASDHGASQRTLRGSYKQGGQTLPLEGIIDTNAVQDSLRSLAQGLI